MEETKFNQEEWSSKIREAAKKLSEENEDYNPAYNYYDTGEITLPDDEEYIIYRIPIDLWEQYYIAKYPGYKGLGKI